MGQDKYVAYVSAYTTGDRSEQGITVYDVDMQKGRFTEKEKIKITNSSYVTLSHNRGICILLRILVWNLIGLRRMAGFRLLIWAPSMG